MVEIAHFQINKAPAGDYKFICSQETGNRIVVDGKNILAEDKINIYLINVSINTIVGSALQINENVKAAGLSILSGSSFLSSILRIDRRLRPKLS